MKSKQKPKSQKQPAYLNLALSPERRTRDLISRMTLKEKVAQMLCIWEKKAGTMVDAQGKKITL